MLCPWDPALQATNQIKSRLEGAEEYQTDKKASQPPLTILSLLSRQRPNFRAFYHPHMFLADFSFRFEDPISALDHIAKPTEGYFGVLGPRIKQD